MQPGISRWITEFAVAAAILAAGEARHPAARTRVKSSKAAELGTPVPPGRMPSFTAGRMLAATLRYGSNTRTR